VSRIGACAAAIAVVLAAPASIRAERTPRDSADLVGSAAGAERHHYVIGARVRPLLMFWITRNDVGDAFVTRSQAPEARAYSLLIGTDPRRTPMHINRWGYIEEEIRGAEARLRGVMTESDEQSVEQAEANVRSQPGGSHPFKVIHATADGAETRARVASINLRGDYTLRQMPEVIDLVERDGNSGSLRTATLPEGTRAGFLTAVADAMRLPAERSVRYVYYGRLYELRRTRSRAIPDARIAGQSYGAAVDADFVISAPDGARTKFSMTYATQGRFAEVPLTIVYQPRWWMQLQLTIDDASAAPAIDGGGDR